MKIGIKDGMKQRIETELEILKSLNHPTIIKYRDSFQNDKKIYIVMDLASGILYIYIYVE